MPNGLHFAWVLVLKHSLNAVSGDSSHVGKNSAVRRDAWNRDRYQRLGYKHGPAVVRAVLSTLSSASDAESRWRQKRRKRHLDALFIPVDGVQNTAHTVGGVC